MGLVILSLSILLRFYIEHLIEQVWESEAFDSFQNEWDELCLYYIHRKEQKVKNIPIILNFKQLIFDIQFIILDPDVWMINWKL